MLIGYKAFNNNMENRYGMKFKEKNLYTVNGDLEFGNRGNGFHFCSRLEDTLRYVDGMNQDINIAKVVSYGKYLEHTDEYYGYYDMYVTSSIFIEKILIREEIIDYILKSNILSIERFLKGYKLTPDEIYFFKDRYAKYMQIIDMINYYQEGKLDTYEKKYIKCNKKMK